MSVCLCLHLFGGGVFAARNSRALSSRALRPDTVQLYASVSVSASVCLCLSVRQTDRQTDTEDDCVCLCLSVRPSVYVCVRARLRACVRACGIEHGWLVCLTSSTHGWVCLTSSTHAGVPDVFHVRGMSQTVFHG